MTETVVANVIESSCFKEGFTGQYKCLPVKFREALYVHAAIVDDS